MNQTRLIGINYVIDYDDESITSQPSRHVSVCYKLNKRKSENSAKPGNTVMA